MYASAYDDFNTILMHAPQPSFLRQVQEGYAKFQLPLEVDVQVSMDRFDQQRYSKKILHYPPPSIVNQFLGSLTQSSVEKINRDLKLSFQWQGVQWMVEERFTHFHPYWSTTRVEDVLMRQPMQHAPFIRCLYTQKEGDNFYILSLIPVGLLENLEAFSNEKGFFSYQFSSQSIDVLSHLIMNGDAQKAREV